MFRKSEEEYRDCIKRKWRQDWSFGPMSCVPTTKDGVPEFVIKAIYYRAVVYSIIAIPFVK